MKIMPLNAKGIPASRLALGCMPFGGEWDRSPLTEERAKLSEAAVDAALSIGINMFDHADIYTRGKSEEAFGRILKSRPGLRDEIVLQSKCGIWLEDEHAPSMFDFSRDHILESVDGSLKRLQTDYLDILLLHRPDPLMEPEEIAEAFGRLKASGKVRYFGVSNMSAAHIHFLESELTDRLVVNQLELGLGRLDFVEETVRVNQSKGTSVNFSDGLMEFSRAENIQLQAWGPLAQGRFTGRDVSGESEAVRKTAELVERLAGERETTREAIVLGWLMKHPAMIQPVIGTMNPQRIEACADAENQSRLMSREDWYRLYMTARGD
ncbi:aldo/keto reductase [Saccharibacillus sp. CPCC 101409]|uniref:aldo/keto reductase n=1 Tax=Saccharibacillus sp. CPCC 101409 TaxID=3058041 RepID=UPI002670E332|nr:aldo/keto reductase [Saccharibacillus sp. CPCC 101409]MDO3410803.1 aldo/keto reductase [Saccharibacillus sp. CPCC 101409]